MYTRQIFNFESMELLEATARKIIGKCRRETIALVEGKERHVVVYVPGGDNKYLSFWSFNLNMHDKYYKN